MEVVGEGDGDGWLRARNYKGEEGYVPHNYLDVEREQSATTPGLVNQISFSSVDYTVDNEEEVVQPSEPNQSPDQVSVISAPQKPERLETTYSYCCALYDYEGEGEELAFEEGQIIKVLSKCAHSVDDGWWQGELEGRIGNFPSLVVEECDEFGEPLTNQWDETPPCSAPPVFTPPDMPEFLMAPQAEVTVTQATPMLETNGIGEPTEPPPPPPPEALEDDEEDEGFPTPPENEEDAQKDAGFTMELNRNQQEHYGTQFSYKKSSVPSKSD